MGWTNYMEGMSVLFEQGGVTLWAILFASILLWILIIERYWAHLRELPGLRAELREQWKNRRTMGEYQSFTRIQALVADLRAEASRNIPALNALTEMEILNLLAFLAGAVVGLALFSQVLHLALQRHHDLVMAVLIGLMAGSVRVLWPWPGGVESTAIGMPEGDWIVAIGLAVVAFVQRLAEEAVRGRGFAGPETWHADVGRNAIEHAHPFVKRAIEQVRGFLSWEPVEMYHAIRDALKEPHDFEPAPSAPRRAAAASRPAARAGAGSSPVRERRGRPRSGCRRTQPGARW